MNLTPILLLALNLGQAVPSFDGSIYVTQYPNGDKPQSPCTAPSGYTETAVGDGGGEVCVPTAGTLDFAVQGSHQLTDHYLAHVSIGGGDGQIEGRITDSYAGASHSFAAIGVGIRDGTSATAYRMQCHSLQNGATAVQCQYGENGSFTTRNCATGTGRPISTTVTLDRDLGDVRGLVSDDGGSTWVQCANDTHTFANAYFSLIGASRSPTETLSATIDQFATSTTIDAYTVSPPQPNNAPVCSGIPDDTATQNQGYSFDVSSYCTDADGDGMTFTASGLSGTGLAISSAGLISGTPNSTAVSGSPLSVQVTATDPSLATGSDTFSLAVNAETPPPSGERDVFFTGTFATSTIKQPGGTTDSFLLHSLFVNQTGNAYFSNSGAATCCASGSGLDTRVVSSDTIRGATVTPRAGPFFVRAELFGRSASSATMPKDYSCMSGTCGVAPNKPRMKLYLSHNNHDFPSLIEQWIGFSLYTEPGFQDERAMGNHANGPILYSMTNTNSEGIMSIRAVNKAPGTSGSTLCSNNSACLQNNDTHFWAMTPLRTTVGDVSPHNATWYDLGPVGACKGKWKDFVIRIVNNPFSSTTDAGNISGAKDITYQGNKGLLEVWSSDCSETPDSTGYRRMNKDVSICNAPVGLVERSGTNQEWDIKFEAYHYGWRTDNPTTRTHSVYWAWDEIRTGQTVRDGTGYADVNPSGRSPESGEAPCSYTPQ